MILETVEEIDRCKRDGKTGGETINNFHAGQVTRLSLAAPSTLLRTCFALLRLKFQTFKLFNRCAPFNRYAQFQPFERRGLNDDNI